MTANKRKQEERYGLPTPYKGRNWGGLPEWNAYHKRQVWQHKHDPKYLAGWYRPSPRTAEAIWTDLAKHGLHIETLLPPIYRRITPKEQIELILTVKQALILALNIFVVAGQRSSSGEVARLTRILDENDPIGRRVTVNQIFDVLALGWSDHFRRVIEAGHAHRARDMRPSTVKAARRDLLRNGIDILAIWDIVASEKAGDWSALGGQNPLYRTERIGLKGRRVVLNPGKDLDNFIRQLRRDGSYGREARGWTILPAVAVSEPRTAKLEACMEIPYNVIAPGPRVKNVIRILESTRLDFNAALFREDYEKNLLGIQEQYGTAYEQALRLPDRLHVKTWIYPLVTRRLHAGNLWPMPVSGRIDRTDEIVLPPDPVAGTVQAENGHRWRKLGSREKRTLRSKSSMRGRWFRFITPDPDNPFDDPCILTGVDVSSSQTTILAVLLGLEKLEKIARKHSFNDYLARRAWGQRTSILKITGTDEDYTGPTDERLKLLVKQLWMRVLYGAPVAWTVRGQWEDSEDVGPGWKKGTRKGQITGAATSFLLSIPQYKKIAQFRKACRRIADRVDKYRGFEFTDPFDQVPVCWNPVERTDVVVKSDGLQILVSVPGRRTEKGVDLETSQSIPAKLIKNLPDTATGEYPIDRKELRKMIAPCLTHNLDAGFAGHVVEHLNRHGVRDIIVIYDAFFTPSDAREAIKMASREWFKSLGSVYTDLLKYLPENDPIFRPLLEAAHAKWKQRVHNENWPEFRVKRDEPIEEWSITNGT